MSDSIPPVPPPPGSTPPDDGADAAAGGAPDYASYPPPPAPRPPRGGGSIWLGIGIFVVALALLAGVTYGVNTYGIYALPADPNVGLGLLLALQAVTAILPLGVLILGIVLAAITRTRRTGAGILIAFGSSILIAGGVCVAMLATIGSGA